MKLNIRNLELDIAGPRVEIADHKLEIRGARFEIQNFNLWVLIFKCEISNLKFVSFYFLTACMSIFNAKLSLLRHLLFAPARKIQHQRGE